MTAPFVPVERYVRAIDADLAQLHLEQLGIATRLEGVHTTSLDPLLGAASGGITLLVEAPELARARAALASLEAAPSEDDDAEPGPRCAACDSPYLMRGWSQLELVLSLALGGLPLALRPRRLRCQRCDTVVQGAPAGGGVGYRTGARRPGDPVFRMPASRSVEGSLAGVTVGALATMMLGGPPLPIVLGPLAGWLLGNALLRAVCSRPGCRAPLTAADERCGRCGGTVEGEVDAPRQHWIAKASWHRGELGVGRRR